MHTEIMFYFTLSLTAFLYSSVGHGGASGYLALMSFYAFSPDTMRSTALILNIFVSLIAFVQYYSNGYFKWKLFWPFALASVPFAFIGGLLSLDAGLYKIILGILLFFPILKLAGIDFKKKQPLNKINIYLALIIGSVIGLISGMIGIGGGIILSPIILMLHWADIKNTAVVSALFIFVNSIAGLTGITINTLNLTNETGFMVIISLAGGLAGSYFGAKKYENILLNKLLIAVLVIASVKLIIT